jgi:hypothetical protein
MPRSPKFPANVPRGYQAIEREAAATRKRLGFDPVEPISAFECMCRLHAFSVAVGGTLVPVDYGVTKLEPGKEGETRFNRERKRLEIILDEDTYSKLDDPNSEDPRARFSYFHELGHAALHGNELVSISAIPESRAEAFMRAHYRGIAPFRDVEWQANAYSGAQMMPAAALETLRKAGRLNVAELCRTFKVSWKAAEIRLDVFLKRRAELLWM